MARKRARKALALCALGVAGFSGTLPATRLAARELPTLLLGPGRGACAALFAAAILWRRREPFPRAQLGSLALVALGVVIGFPLCTSLALTQLPAHHAVVIVGLTPLTTSIMSALRSGERPSLSFWLCALFGAGSVAAFGIANNPSASLTLAPADGLLLLGVLLVSIGYTEGARLTARLDGLYVICWALIVALPFSTLAVAWSLHGRVWQLPSFAALASFAWVSLISSLLAFAAWYRGLGLGGVARGSQLQLTQPVLSLIWCALILGESVSLGGMLAGAAVLLSAAGSRWARAA